jgi:hypothetical protein
MDPNAVLEDLREMMDQADRGGMSYDERVNLLDNMSAHFRSLDQWMTTGGFLPSDWAR